MSKYRVGFVAVEYTNMDVDVEADTIDAAITKAKDVVLKPKDPLAVFCHRGDPGLIRLVVAERMDGEGIEIRDDIEEVIYGTE